MVHLQRVPQSYVRKQIQLKNTLQTRRPAPATIEEYIYWHVWARVIAKNPYQKKIGRSGWQYLLEEAEDGEHQKVHVLLAVRQLVAFEPLSQALDLIISRNSEAFMLTSQSMTISVFFFLDIIFVSVSDSSMWKRKLTKITNFILPAQSLLKYCALRLMLPLS